MAAVKRPVSTPVTTVAGRGAACLAPGYRIPSAGSGEGTSRRSTRASGRARERAHRRRIDRRLAGQRPQPVDPLDDRRMGRHQRR